MTDQERIKCKDCSFATFVPSNGGPGRYYCDNPDAKYATSPCIPRPMICRTERGKSEVTIKTAPKWCPVKTGKKVSKRDL